MSEIPQSFDFVAACREVSPISSATATVPLFGAS
jgi:hypothetical protein